MLIKLHMIYQIFTKYKKGEAMIKNVKKEGKVKQNYQFFYISVITSNFVVQ